jgi:hypothetical protein
LRPEPWRRSLSPKQVRAFVDRDRGAPMKPAKPVAYGFVLLAIGLLACSKSDPRCSKVNCEAILTCSIWLFPTLPCGSLPLGGQSEASIQDEAMQGCVDVCNEQGSGPFVQCVADKFPGTACTDIFLDGGNRFATVVTTCAGGDAGPCGPNCLKCSSACGDTTTTCNASCLKAGTLGACVACNTDCGKQWTQCNQGCPSD